MVSAEMPDSISAPEHPESNWPCSQSVIAAVAVIGFEIEPRRYSVCDVAGTEFSRSAIPKPPDHTNSPSCSAATDMPGTLFAAMNVATALSILAWLSSDSFLV